VRALFLERVLPAGLDVVAYAAADYEPLHSWAAERLGVNVRADAAAVVIELASTGPHRLGKTLELHASGEVRVTYAWDPGAFPQGATFAPELSVAIEPELELDPEPLALWSHPITTVSKRESGLEETVQGTSLTPLWPISEGRARVVLRLPSD
jgi:hypothetical protein